MAEKTGVERVQRYRWQRYVLMAAGWLCLALGVIGVAVPVLPTTPFILLASYFFVRSSPQLHERLLRSRMFGPILDDWQLQRGIRRRVKFQTITMILLAVAASLLLVRRSAVATLAISALAAVGLAVVLALPTINTVPPGRRREPRQRG